MSKVVKFIEAAALSILAIFAPIQSLLAATGFMIFADLFTGLLAAHKRGEPITSAGLRRSLTKIFVYEAALMLAFLAEHYISDILPFVKMASSMIALVELKSIYENLSAFSGDPLLKVLVDKLGSSNQEKE